MNQNTKILIIDDNSFDRGLLLEALLEKGFKAMGLEDSERFLEVIYSHKPDMVLLDTMMPKNRGSNILRTIREKFSSIELPVIMMSDLTDVSVAIESFALGSNDYITKPISYEIAERRILTHLKIAMLASQLESLKKAACRVAQIVNTIEEGN